MGKEYGTSREPDSGLWHDHEYQDLIRETLTNETDRYIDENAFKNTMQEDYNEMINSVKKYGGFYVGRYEMGLNNRKAISKAGPATHSGNWDDRSHRWYGLYAHAKTYTKKENSVKSSMIWGSQYDAMLNFALTGNDKDKVTGTENGNRGSVAINTGATKDDKIINIFDLGGNYCEWTLETYSDGYRTIRGDKFRADQSETTIYSPSSRHYEHSTDNTAGFDSTRITLYIQ